MYTYLLKILSCCLFRLTFLERFRLEKKSTFCLELILFNIVAFIKMRLVGYFTLIRLSRSHVEYHVSQLLVRLIFKFEIFYTENSVYWVCSAKKPLMVKSQPHYLCIRTLTAVVRHQSRCPTSV